MRLYIITNIVNAMEYVGITGGAVETRFSQHCYKAARGKPGPLYDALRKYGPDNFRVFCIGEAHSRKQLFDTEMNEIKKRRTPTPHGYNTTLGGPGVKLPRQMTLDERQRRARARQQRNKV